MHFTKDWLQFYSDHHGFEIGDYSYGNPNIYLWSSKARLKLGRFCSIAGGVNIFLGGNHPLDWVSTYPFPAFKDAWPEVAHLDGHERTNGDITIGNDVWLGQDCSIMSGVTIGDGAAVATRAVVTKDVPPYAVVGGNPARIIRYRFDELVISRLLHVKWWDLSEGALRTVLPLMASPDIAAFLAAVDDEPLPPLPEEPPNVVVRGARKVRRGLVRLLALIKGAARPISGA